LLERQLQQYKFFFLDDRGHVFRSQDHLFQDDIAALEAGQRLKASHIIEIWQGAREVARVKPDGSALPHSGRQTG
jgi:hypothetical protein